MNIWEDRKAVEQYEMEADVAIPDRRQMLSIISRLAIAGTSYPPIIADLGGGSGDLTAAMLELRPIARIEMVDFSDEICVEG